MKKGGMKTRVAGLLYLLLTVLGPFSMMFVPSQVVSTTDGVRTVHLLEHAGLFRLGIASDLLVVVTELALTAILFVAFEGVGRKLALTSTFARLAMTVLQACNVVLSLAALRAPADSTLALLDLHGDAVHVWEVTFALHCVLLGVLVFRHGAIPRVFGVLLAIAGVGYGLNGLGTLLVPELGPVFAQVVALTAIVGEVPFVGYLLVKGLPAAPARASAS